MNFSHKQYQAVCGILPLVSSTEYNVFQGTASTNTWFLLWLNEPPVGTRRDLLIHSPVDAHGGCFPFGSCQQGCWEYFWAGFVRAPAFKSLVGTTGGMGSVRTPCLPACGPATPRLPQLRHAMSPPATVEGFCFPDSSATPVPPAWSGSPLRGGETCVLVVSACVSAPSGEGPLPVCLPGCLAVFLGEIVLSGIVHVLKL